MMSDRKPDIGYIPTPQAVVDAMLDLACLMPNDILYDLGSGDGRIVVTAAQRFGIRAVGVDIDPKRIQEARENAQRAGVDDRVEFRLADLFECDFHNATVVTLYLLPHLNLRLLPKLLAQLKPGTRIFSYNFPIEGWKPKHEVQVESEEEDSTIYGWTIPHEGI
jgi:cyclopropane fatty-acyl-phospholipid synthase-like methyltransferase